MTEPIPTQIKSYLGDGAYVSFNGYAVTLTAEDGIRATDSVVLGEREINALLNFLITQCGLKMEKIDAP